MAFRNNPASGYSVDAKTPYASVATGRLHALFAEDLVRCRSRIAEIVGGKRILCVGGAGSIGSGTALLVAEFAPQSVHVVDQDENALTELVRIFHARGGAQQVKDFRALPLDYGSPVMQMFLRQEGPYDVVLNFAAIKHVRSEKDAFCVLQMLDTNVLKQARFLRWLDGVGFGGRYFSVSTDKAANPTSMMGATKRIMEHLIFAAETALTIPTAVTSARFANVAFSNGSLLQSFDRRLARGEPLSAPRDTRRYFISLEEASQICLIAGAVAPHRTIVIPRLDARKHLVSLQEVAERFLAWHGYAAQPYDDECEARANVARDATAGRWPLLLTLLDTSGEKPYEEFVGEGEQVVEIGCESLLGVDYRPARAGTLVGLISEIVRYFESAGTGMRVDKEILKGIIGEVEPRFLQSHRETGRSLDQRM